MLVCYLTLTDVWVRELYDDGLWVWLGGGLWGVGVEMLLRFRFERRFGIISLL